MANVSHSICELCRCSLSFMGRSGKDGNYAIFSKMETGLTTKKI